LINVYAPTADDYSNNGLLVLDPWCVSARIREKLNGEYTLTLELEINARTVEVVNEMVIKAPAPVRFTPQLDIYTPSATEIWKVNTNTRRLSLRTKPSTTTGRVLHAYKKGTEVIVTDKSNPNWYVVAAPDGRSGYMEVRWLQYVRDEYSAPVTTGVIEQHKTKEQLFRVRSVSSTLDTITVEAQHISYDLRRNYIKSAATKGKAGAEAFPVMMAATLSAHEFDAYSDIETEITEDIKRTNPIAALFSDGGLVSMAGGEVLRDNFDIYWVRHIGQDRGVTVAYRKNMAGMDVKIDTNGLVTRIIPVGYSKNNEPIYGDPIDSPHIDEYAQPYIVEYEYKDVKVGSGYKTAAEVKTEIERRARLEYDNGIDLPTVSASVDYVDLQNTDIGVDFNAFTGVFLGDTIRIRHEDYRFDIATEINAYEWDVLLGEYVSLELGSKQASLSDVRISPSQIGNGTLAGRKLAAGTVSGAELGEGSVGENHITENAVTEKKIADGAVTADKIIAGSVTAEKIAADSITAEKISAEAVTADKIKAGAVTAAKIDAGAVTAEKIASKTITADQIAAGTITAESGIIANGAIGTAQIADGSITSAKVVDLNADVIKTGTLSADRLLLAGDNGVIYKINATSAGLSMTELSKDQYKHYINGTVIVAKSITAAQIAAKTITSNEILAGTITAAEINVSDLFAAEATIQALNAADISGNESLHLYVSGKLGYVDEEVAALRTEINLVPGKIELAVSEIDEFHAGTTVDITKDEFRVSTPEFVVDIVDDDGETSMLSIDENGARMQTLVCPDVAPRYNGPATLNVNKSATSAQIAAGTHYRSIADAAAALSNRWIGKNVVVYVAAGTVEYGTVTLQGAYGSGSIYIIGDEISPAKLVGKLQIMYSGCPVLVRYLNVDSASGGVGIDCAGSATMAIIENCVITGKGVSVSDGRGVRVFRGAHADVHGCELYDHERSLYALQTGTIRAYNNRGNCRIAAEGGTIYASGSMPCDTDTFAYGAYAGQVIMASDITVNGNAATPPAVETTPTTVDVTASATDSWYSASGAWINQDNVIRQGYYSGMGEWSGCFWFPTTSFSGKTIKTASLTLTRTAGSGKSGEVTLTLYGITIASASGNPNSGRVSYGALGTIGNGETKAFTLPTTAAQALANGTIKGFMLCAGDGKVMSGRSYSTNYCKIGSSGDVLPQLSVSY